MITLHFNPEIETGLLAQAQASGMSVEQYLLSRAPIVLIPRLLQQGESVFFCPQNITEFWNAATRPIDRNGLGFSTDEIRQEEFQCC